MQLNNCIYYTLKSKLYNIIIITLLVISTLKMQRFFFFNFGLFNPNEKKFYDANLKLLTISVLFTIGKRKHANFGKNPAFCNNNRLCWVEKHSLTFFFSYCYLIRRIINIYIYLYICIIFSKFE